MANPLGLGSSDRNIIAYRVYQAMLEGTLDPSAIPFLPSEIEDTDALLIEREGILYRVLVGEVFARFPAGQVFVGSFPVFAGNDNVVIA
jgi:hypothetical protein